MADKPLMPQQTWYWRNREKARESARRRFHNNRKRYMAKQAEWRRVNRRKIVAYQKRYYEANIEAFRARSKKYYHEVVIKSPEARERHRLSFLRWYKSLAGQAWFARWRKKNNIHQRVFRKNWRERNARKVRANEAVARAIKSGKLVRLPCACGNKKTEAHHRDYSRPFDVKWMCRACHRKTHSARRKNRP